jgi:hypothetical protein
MENPIGSRKKKKARKPIINGKTRKIHKYPYIPVFFLDDRGNLDNLLYN